ncbi:MAG TPA: MFS transporter, partial [Candidatus Limnocylindria bacterium]|nr:MFS transporter [Candidatus Limnocylindria bacterium]
MHGERGGKAGGGVTGAGAWLRRNRLVHTLVSLEGNARWCVWTEPMWGIPYYLYIPLMSKYMEALGLSPLQIGVVATVFVVSQMTFAFFAGAVTDRLGRRWTTTAVDVLCWCVPFLLWMNARGFAWFVVAAAINGLWRITENSWGLLLAEDAPEGLLVNIYSLVAISGLLAGFFSPLTSLLVARFSLVPVMRGIFLFGFIVFTTKLVILHVKSHETETGRKRMEELRGKPLFHSVRGSMGVIRGMLSRRAL